MNQRYEQPLKNVSGKLLPDQIYVDSGHTDMLLQ